MGVMRTKALLSLCVHASDGGFCSLTHLDGPPQMAPAMSDMGAKKAGRSPAWAFAAHLGALVTHGCSANARATCADLGKGAHGVSALPDKRPPAHGYSRSSSQHPPPYLSRSPHRHGSLPTPQHDIYRRTAAAASTTGLTTSPPSVRGRSAYGAPGQKRPSSARLQTPATPSRPRRPSGPTQPEPR